MVESLANARNSNSRMAAPDHFFNMELSRSSLNLNFAKTSGWQVLSVP